MKYGFGILACFYEKKTCLHNGKACFKGLCLETSVPDFSRNWIFFYSAKKNILRYSVIFGRSLFEACVCFYGILHFFIDLTFNMSRGAYIFFPINICYKLYETIILYGRLSDRLQWFSLMLHILKLNDILFYFWYRMPNKAFSRLQYWCCKK